MQGRFVSILAAGLLGASLNVAAEDGKIHPGANCIDGYNTGDLRSYGGRIYNNSSTSARTFECPGVKDSMGSNQIHDATVYVIDQNYNSNVGCSLWTQNSTTTGAWGFYTSRSSSGTNPTPQALSFPAQPIYSNHGYSVIRCTLPPRYSGQVSRLVCYRIDKT